jgi:GNAT superfamily N-acetyltransferase
MQGERTAQAAQGFRIALVTPRQRDAVLELWLELIEYHRRLDPNYPALAGLRELVGRELDRALRAERSRVWIAETEGAPRAFLLAEIESDRPLASGATCWVHEVYVQDGFRRRGIASALVASAEEFFQQANGGRRAVRVEASNRSAQRFWKRAGFSERARILERPG